MADPAAAAAPMTIDFLRARLLSERSVSRASKERADQLAARVAELEEQVRAVTPQRRQAEREAEEVLAILESKGFCGSLDSGSDADEEEQDDEPRHAMVTGNHGEEGQGQEQEQPPAKGEAEKEEEALSGTAAQQQKEQPGGLSWKGRCASPRKARQLRQRHRRSYVYVLASEPDPSPKYRLGQSCRKNKRKELSSVAVLPESQKEQRNGPGCADDGRAKLDGEAAGGDDHRSSGDGGQYVVRYDNGGEMERVLEKQAELIGQHEAQEKAQTDWERQFNGSRTSPANKGDVEADCQASSQDKSRGENSDGGSSGHTNSVSSAIKAPSESSPSMSKGSDWSSSRFHDHEADDACRRWSGDVADVESVLQALQRARISLRQKLDRPLPPSQVTLALPAPGDEYRGNEDDLCSTNGNSSYRGSSPSRQEMLALPAPEGYLGHGYHDRDHASAYFSADGADACSSRPRQEFLALPSPGDDDGEGEMKIPVGSLGLFRLPTDSFPEDETLSRSNGHDVELGLGDADGHDAYRHDGAGVPVKQLYDPHGTYGRCSNVPPGSGFTAGGGASFLSGLPDDLREGRGRLAVANADLFMQRGGDYNVSNR